jgi:DNA-binding CsgD family transcriptional regulator
MSREMARTRHRSASADGSAYVPHARALCSADPLLLVQARALSLVVALAPSTVAVFHRVSQRLEAERAVGLQTARPDFLLPEEWLHYLEHEQHIDPFAARRVSRSDATVLTLRDVCEDATLPATAFQRYLRGKGMGDRVTVYLRDAGTIAAAIALTRSQERPPFGNAEIAILRRAQPLIEHAYTCALAVAGATRGSASDVVLSAGLTPREADVAALVAKGSTNAEIARRLNLSLATVKTHLTRIYTKLGVRSRTQLALRLGAAGDPASQPYADRPAA